MGISSVIDQKGQIKPFSIGFWEAWDSRQEINLRICLGSIKATLASHTPKPVRNGTVITRVECDRSLKSDKDFLVRDI